MFSLDLSFFLLLQTCVFSCQEGSGSLVTGEAPSKLSSEGPFLWRPLLVWRPSSKRNLKCNGLQPNSFLLLVTSSKARSY